LDEEVKEPVDSSPRRADRGAGRRGPPTKDELGVDLSFPIAFLACIPAAFNLSASDMLANGVAVVAGTSRGVCSALVVVRWKRRWAPAGLVVLGRPSAWSG